MPADLRFLVGCAGLIGLGAGLLWAGGVIGRALDEAHDIFDEDDDVPPLILPNPKAYDAPGWMT